MPVKNVAVLHGFVSMLTDAFMYNIEDSLWCLAASGSGFCLELIGY